jgi:O-antigen/teichoic acid export membrane protein
VNRSIWSGILSVVGSKVLILIVGILTTPILVRLLGIPAFGQYSFVLSTFSVFMIFISSGITDGVRKFIAEDRPVVDWSEHVVGFYFRLAVLFAGVGAGLLWYAAELGVVERFVGSEFTVYFYALAALVVAAQFRSFARKTLMGFGLERYSEPLQVLDTLAFVAVGLPLVYLGHGVLGALAGRAIASLLVAVIGLALIHRTSSLRYVFHRSPSNFPRHSMLTFNSMSIVLVFLLTSLYHVDVLMLQTFRGSTAVGNYKIALKIAEFLWFIPMTVQTVYVHSTSELWSKNRHGKISALAARTTRYTLLLTSLMAIGLAALSGVVVPLYGGSSSTPAITPLLLLLPGALGFAVARPILAVAQGKGDLAYPVLATGMAAAINLSLNLVLIPLYGMEGAAVATTVGYGSMGLFHFWSARKVGFDPLADARLVRVALTAAFAAPLVFLLPSLVKGDLLTLAVVPPLGLATFACCALVTGAFGIGELLEVLASFPEPIGGVARDVYWTYDETNFTPLVTSTLQNMLIVVGVLLLISGTGVALLGSSGGVGDTVSTATGPSTTTDQTTSDGETAGGGGTSGERTTTAETTSDESTGGETAPGETTTAETTTTEENTTASDNTTADDNDTTEENATDGDDTTDDNTTAGDNTTDDNTTASENATADDNTTDDNTTAGENSTDDNTTGDNTTDDNTTTAGNTSDGNATIVENVTGTIASTAEVDPATWVSSLDWKRRLGRFG